ncbi:DNA cytosine methyltransferase, partial [Photobacterium carnosum]
LGYKVHYKVLNALDFGVPQKRERTFIVGFLDHDIPFEFPIKKESYDLSKVLEPDELVPDNFFVSDEIRNNRQENLSRIAPYPSIWHQNISGNVSPLPYSGALRSGASHNYLLVNGYRRLTSREMLRIQGFPEDYRIVVSHTQLKKQAGNSVAVPVIKAIAESMIQAMKQKRLNVA